VVVVPQAQQLGRYHLLDRIAFGGMAEIYRAKTFDETGRAYMVAVKRVLPHLIEDEEFLQMLVDEARIASRIAHPNVAQVYEFGRAGDDHFIAMEHVDGKDLRAILERCRQRGELLAPTHAAFVAAEVASALGAAHGLRDDRGILMNVVHRDVSPSNVLCGYEGQVKLCDFGIAKATLSQVKTRAGIIKGKVKYMSPEQAVGRPLDHRSDLFALGTVLYEALALKAPFAGAGEMEILLKIRDGILTPIHEVRPDTPPSLVAIVEKALARGRGARYQSGDDMSVALRSALAELSPGYGRSMFAAFVASLFERERMTERKRLGEYTLTAGDRTRIGENLIAGTLPPGSPWAQFTPMTPSLPDALAGLIRDVTPDPITGQRHPDALTGPAFDPPSGDHPGENNDEFAPQPTLVDPPREWHSDRTEETPASVPPPGLHDTQTRLLPAGAGSASLHDERTRILSPALQTLLEKKRE
jgi:serine/threonine-protein kinase